MVFLGIQGQNRRKMYSQKWPNMGGESCTVLRLRLMRQLAMPHTGFNGINVVLLSWRREEKKCCRFAYLCRGDFT